MDNITEMSAGRTFENITEQEITLAGEMGIDLSASVEERLERVVTKTNNALRLVVEAGLDLISIKSECEHGEFGGMLEARGLNRQRASEMMKFARFAARLPAADRSKALTLPKKQALLLANTDPDIVQNILDDEESFDDVSTLNYQSMRDHIRQLEADKANLETELDTANVQQEDLKARLKKERAGSAYPDFVVVTRHESHALSEKAMLCVDDMNRLVSDLISINQNSGTEASAEFDHHLRMSTSTLAVHLEAVMHKASDALRLLSGHLPPDATAKVNADFLYSDEEISHAISERELLVREHEQEKQIRENQREMQKPRGRGRPKNSTKKD